MRPTITFCVIMQSSHRVILLPPIFIPFLVTGSIAAFNCLGFVFHDPCSQEKRDCAAASLNTAHKILVASKIINSYSQSENVPEVRDNLLAVERSDEHIVNLTNFVDNAVTLHTEAPSASMRLFSGITNPYPPQDVLRFLSRKFEVYRFPWDAADVQGAQIAKISFPDALLGLNTIVDKLRWFKYMRSSVEIEIRLNTTQFHYGQLMITWLPFYRGGPADADRYRSANMWVASNNNPMTMSAAQSSSLTFTIPYMSPFSYFDIHGTGLWDPTCTIGTVFVHAITPLGVASQALTTVDCVVFASFKDPDVAGYTPNNLVYLPVAEAQSGRVVDEASKKASQNTILSVQDTVETATGFIKQVTGAGSDLLQLATTLAPVAMALLDKPRNAQPMQPVFLSNAQDICTGDGTDNAVPLSLATDVNLNATTPIMDTSPSQPTLLSLLMHPSLIGVFSIDVTQAVSSLSYSTRVIPNVFAPVGVGNLVAAGPLAWHSQFFRYWRGSMKYTFQFRTSSFTTARVRIWHMPVNSDPVTAPLDAGDVVTALLDIRGDTDFSLTVPYLQRAPWCPVRFGTPLSPDYRYDDMKLAVTLVTSPLSPDATDDAVIHCSVWKAAGEDFQFNQYLDQTRIITGTQGINWTGVAEAQSLVETFSKPFDTVIPGVHFEVERGYVTPETPYYLTDLMKRYSVGSPITTQLREFDTSVPYDVQFSQGAYPNNLQLLLSGFMFWRGSLRKKTIWLQASSGNYMSSIGWTPGTDLADTDSGALYLSSSTNPVMGVEVPWYYPVPFRPLYQSLTARGSVVDPQSVTFQTLSPSPNLATLHAVGEDFGVAVLTGYPMIDFSLLPEKSPTPPPSSVNAAPRGASARTHSTGTGLSSF